MTARGIIHLAAAAAATTTTNDGMPSCLPSYAYGARKDAYLLACRAHMKSGRVELEIGRRWVATLWQNYRLQEKRNHVTIMTE